MAHLHDNQMTLTGADNGKTVKSPVMNGFTGISAKWNDQSVAPAGRLAFTVNGDDMGGKNIIDLGSGERGLESSAPLAFVDIGVSGIPAGGAVTLYFR